MKLQADGTFQTLTIVSLKRFQSLFYTSQWLNYLYKIIITIIILVFGLSVLTFRMVINSPVCVCVLSPAVRPVTLPAALRAVLRLYGDGCWVGGPARARGRMSAPEGAELKALLCLQPPPLPPYSLHSPPLPPATQSAHGTSPAIPRWDRLRPSHRLGFLLEHSEHWTVSVSLGSALQWHRFVHLVLFSLGDTHTITHNALCVCARVWVCVITALYVIQ